MLNALMIMGNRILRYCQRYVVVTVIALCSSANAMLDLSLTQGFDAAIPVAIIPFGNITPIMTNDFRLSGQFRPVDATTLQGSTDTDQLLMRAKNELKVSNIIDGKVVCTDDHCETSVKVFDVYKADHAVKDQQGSLLNPIIFNRVYQFRHAQERQIAHRISDAVYEKLTGIPGAFATKIAYVARFMKDRRWQYQLLVADSDGFNPKPVLVSRDIIMSPAWSPDGKQLAYVSFENHYPAIYLADVATGSRRLISRVEGINGAPAFSPDGRQLALVLSKTGSPSIYLYDINLGTFKSLLQDNFINTEPHWLPDSRSLLFTSNRSGNPQVYQYYLADGTIKRLTYEGHYNASPQITPDGKTLVFLHQDEGVFTVAKQDLLTGRLVVLTPEAMTESPHIAPNGQLVVYIAREGQARRLALVSMNGRSQVLLPVPVGASVQEPVWSPFLM